MATFAFLTVLAPFVLLELATRTFYRPPIPEQFQVFVNPEWKMEYIYLTDPVLYWKFRPSITLRVYSQQYGAYPIRINNQSFRGEDWPRNRPINHFLRVLVIGDSCGFGWGSAEKGSFPEQMETLMNSRPDLLKPVDVMNASTPGYSSHQALRLLERWGEEYRPHFVIPFVGSNDVLPCSGLDDLELSKVPKDPDWQTFLQRFYSWVYLENLVKGPDPLRERADEIKRISEEAPDEAPRRVSLDQFEKNLREIHRITLDLGARNVFLTRQHASEHPLLDRYNSVVRSLAAETNSPLVDVAQGFLRYASTEVYYDVSYDHVHPNNNGYEMIAKAVAEVLLDRMKTDPEFSRAFDTAAIDRAESQSVAMEGDGP